MDRNFQGQRGQVHYQAPQGSWNEGLRHHPVSHADGTFPSITDRGMGVDRGKEVLTPPLMSRLGQYWSSAPRHRGT